VIPKVWAGFRCRLSQIDPSNFHNHETWPQRITAIVCRHHRAASDLFARLEAILRLAARTTLFQALSPILLHNSCGATIAIVILPDLLAGLAAFLSQPLMANLPVTEVAFHPLGTACAALFSFFQMRRHKPSS